jgi:hypothetical protein
VSLRFARSWPRDFSERPPGERRPGEFDRARVQPRRVPAGNRCPLTARATTSAGLFSPRGPLGMGQLIQSFADFAADFAPADLIVTRKVQPPQFIVTQHRAGGEALVQKPPTPNAFDAGLRVYHLSAFPQCFPAKHHIGTTTAPRGRRQRETGLLQFKLRPHRSPYVTDGRDPACGEGPPRTVRREGGERCRSESRNGRVRRLGWRSRCMAQGGSGNSCDARATSGAALAAPWRERVRKEQGRVDRNAAAGLSFLSRAFRNAPGSRGQSLLADESAPPVLRISLRISL